MATPPTHQPYSEDAENVHGFNQGINSLENEGAYAIIPDVEKLTAEGHTILNFGPGQPDFPTPQHVKDAGCDAIQGNQTTYTNPSGTGDIKQEIAMFMNRTRKLEGDNVVKVREDAHSWHRSARCSDAAAAVPLSPAGPDPRDEPS